MADFTNGAVTPHSVNGDLRFPVLLGPDGKPLRGRAKDERAIGLALPHAMTFIARQSGGMGSYWHDRFDECLRFNREYSETMANDGFLSGLMQERKLATYSLVHSWHLEIADEKDAFQRRVRDCVTAIIKSIPFFGRVIYSLLDAIWYGKQGTQFQWGWRASPDPMKQKALTVLDWLPIQGDKIGHQFIDPETQTYVEQPYVLIDSAYAGQLQDRGAKIITTTLGQALVLQGDWRDRFLIHKHLIEDADWFYSDKAEAVHGVGVRSKIFWSNWLKWEWLANITDFFDRIGLGITVWKYPQGNDAALKAVQQAANDQSNRAHLFVPIAPDSGKESSGVERVEVPTTGSTFLREMIEYLDKIMERYVVGQEASSKGTSAGMGNEATADFQRDTKRAITLFDSDMLAQTLTGSPREPGLVNTIVRCTYPEADFPVSFCFDLESGESEKKLTAIKTVVDMGIKVKADEARRAAGLSKPIDGDELIQPPQAPGMPPGAPPGMGGEAGGGESGIPQPGEGGITQDEQPEAGSAGTSGPGQGGGEGENGGGATYLKANTGVSAETGRPLADSRYVNAETGKVKHFPQAPGEGENGKPIAGKRIQTENGKTPGLDTNSASSQPDTEKTTGKVGREAFQYTDQAKNHAETCSKCRFFDAEQSKCHLYEQLNAEMPEKFSLQEQVSPSGWCQEFEAKQNDANSL